jgi:dipeptidyl aminopeptidase/acylaminoacyl peptidase
VGTGRGQHVARIPVLRRQGYGIVYANPRGSGGYGFDFLRANYQDWGGGPASDVLAAATEAARARGWIPAGR